MSADGDVIRVGVVVFGAMILVCVDGRAEWLPCSADEAKLFGDSLLETIQLARGRHQAACDHEWEQKAVQHFECCLCGLTYVGPRCPVNGRSSDGS